MPLDMNVCDPDVLEIYQAATLRHALNAALLGLAPPAIFYALSRLIWR